MQTDTAWNPRRKRAEEMHRRGNHFQQIAPINAVVLELSYVLMLLRCVKHI